MSYDLTLISVTLVITYILSYALYRENIIKRSLHARIWNILIFISFTVSAGMGILWAGLKDFDISVPLNIDLNYWHAEVGIAMFVIILFHLHWNWSSFKKLYKN